MAGQIKGITIEFRGDTTSLDKALRKVKTDSRDIDTELKKVNNSLRFNPKNTELLAQKQKLLRDKVAQTEKSLSDLKKIQSQMDDDPAIDKNSREYQKLRREIIETESKLKHFKTEAQKLSSVKLTALRAQLDDLSKKFKTAGDSLTKYVTIPLAAVGGASAAAFNGVADSMNIITKLTGASGKDLEDMQNIARSIGENVPADFDSIATAVGEVNTRFGITGKELEDVSEKFVKYADLNGVDVVTAVDSTQKAMSAFGLSSSDAGYALDVLTRVSQNTGVSVDRLTSGLVSNSTAFQEMGLDINQSSTLMGMLEKSGVNMETATNGMRRALKNASADGKDMNTALIELQDAIQNDKDGTEGLTKAYELFGKSGDQIYGAVKAGSLDFRAIAEASTDASGALDNTFDSTITPAKKFQTVINRLKLLGYDIANSVLPVIVPLIEKLADGIDKITKKWNKLPKGVQKRIVAVAAALAAIGPILLIISKGLALVSAAIGVAQGVVAGLSRALAFLAANPVVAVIAAIAALVAAIVILWKKNEAFRTFIINLWNGIKTKAKAIWDAITGFFTSSVKKAKDAWNGIGQWFTQKWEAIKAAFGKVKEFFTTKFSGAVSGIKAGFKGVASWFGQRWSDIKGKFGKVKEFFSTTFGGAWSAIKDKFKGWGEFWSGLWTKVKDKFKSISTKISTAISDGLKSGINNMLSGLESKLNHVVVTVNRIIKFVNDHSPLNIPTLGAIQLPRLAKGGIVDSATLALIGEGQSSEAVIPLDELWKRLDKMTDSLTGSGGGAPIVVNVYGAEGQSVQSIADAVCRKLIEKEQRRRLAWQ